MFSGLLFLMTVSLNSATHEAQTNVPAVPFVEHRLLSHSCSIPALRFGAAQFESQHDELDLQEGSMSPLQRALDLESARRSLANHLHRW